MEWGGLAILLGGVTMTWGLAVASWRWTLRRLRLSGPAPSSMGERERLVRRSLRALMAFEFLCIYPICALVSVTAVVMAVAERDPHALLIALAMLGAGLVLSVPLPSILKLARQLERQRVDGGPEPTAVSLWIDGGRALFDPANPRRGRLLRFALGIVLLVAAMIAWRTVGRWQALGLAVMAVPLVWMSLARAWRG
jgi:hypothetical protein